MNLNYSKKGVTFAPSSTYTVSDGTVVATYQGCRGDNPHLRIFYQIVLYSNRV